MTFTNHALDDILEDLLDPGITELVRIGGRSRSERLSEYNLRELGRSGKAPFSREQTRRYAQLKGDIAVVMIGYQKEMENMMSHVNPGLSRRFQIDEAFHFPDFDDAALVRYVALFCLLRYLALNQFFNL